MVNNSSSTARTFCFASGELLTLELNQIDKIPYLSALVSSADKFKLARDEENHLKLDRWINYNDFMFIVESLSFTCITQLFIHLPKEIHVIPIIALWDFLGLASQSSPTLRKVDSTFFSNVEYNPLKEDYSRIINTSIMQDMAVRFAIAIVKEEYDFSNNDVVDHIYWLVMFILSAYKWFEINLRHHIYTIIKNCFTVFKPSQLKSLNRLHEKMNYDVKEKFFFSNKYGNNYMKTTFIYPKMFCYDYVKNIYLPNFGWSNIRYNYEEMFWAYIVLTEEKLLEPVNNEVLKSIYYQLQSQICRRAINILCKKENGGSLQMSECMILPYTIHSLFNSQYVQQKIRELISMELSNLKPNCEIRLRELRNDLKLYELFQSSDNQTEYNRSLFSLYIPLLSYEDIQDQISIYMLLLDKLDHSPDTVIDQIHENVFKALYDAALKQFNSWSHTQLEIDELRESLTPEFRPEYRSAAVSRKAYRHHSNFIPKHQFKYSK